MVGGFRGFLPKPILGKWVDEAGQNGGAMQVGDHGLWGKGDVFPHVFHNPIPDHQAAIVDLRAGRNPDDGVGEGLHLGRMLVQSLHREAGLGIQAKIGSRNVQQPKESENQFSRHKFSIGHPFWHPAKS